MTLTRRSFLKKTGLLAAAGAVGLKVPLPSLDVAEPKHDDSATFRQSAAEPGRFIPELSLPLLSDRPVIDMEQLERAFGPSKPVVLGSGWTYVRIGDLAFDLDYLERSIWDDIPASNRFQFDVSEDA